MDLLQNDQNHHLLKDKKPQRIERRCFVLGLPRRNRGMTTTFLPLDLGLEIQWGKNLVVILVPRFLLRKKNTSSPVIRFAVLVICLSCRAFGSVYS